MLGRKMVLQQAANGQCSFDDHKLSTKHAYLIAESPTALAVRVEPHNIGSTGKRRKTPSSIMVLNKLGSWRKSDGPRVREIDVVLMIDISTHYGYGGDKIMPPSMIRMADLTPRVVHHIDRGPPAHKVVTSKLQESQV